MDDSLRYLLAVAEHGNLSRAAESLFISQPALSRYMTRLEVSVGVQLLDRSARPLVLTPQGQRYRDYLQGVEQLKAAMEADLEGMTPREAESVRVGATVWRSSTVLPEVIPSVLRKNPDLRLTLFEGSNSQLHAGVKAGKLDLALMNSAEAGSGVQYERIITERIVLVGAGLSEIKEKLGRSWGSRVVSPQRVKSVLQGSSLILLHPEHHLGAVSRDFLADIGVRGMRVLNTHNITTAVKLAARGVGLAFAPEGLARDEVDLPFIHIKHVELVQAVGLAWPVGSKASPGVELLADTMRKVVQSMAHSDEF